MYIALYAPSSVQRIIDFQKTVYTLGEAIPVIVKPIGAAAQLGVPEAYRIAYRLGKPLIVLPEIKDLKEIFKPSEIYYISGNGVEYSLKDIIQTSEIGIILPGGDQEPGKKELEGVKIIRFKEIPSNTPSIALTGIILFYARSIHTMSNT